MSGLHRSHRHLFVTGVVLARLIPASAAEAHAHLMTSLPAADSITAAPGDIELRFSEAPLATLSGVQLQVPSGAIVPVSSRNMGKDMLVVVPQHPLGSGSYTVRWHVVTADTHRTQGAFAFTVR